MSTENQIQQYLDDLNRFGWAGGIQPPEDNYCTSTNMSVEEQIQGILDDIKRDKPEGHKLLEAYERIAIVSSRGFGSKMESMGHNREASLYWLTKDIIALA